MNYRIKNIDYWIQFCPQNDEIKNWKNDECHTMIGETEKQAVAFNVADETSDISMEQEAERMKKQDDEAAEVVREALKENKKESFVCECGKVCKSKAGLKTHQRSCKFTQQ